jgi:hypothetical protein
LLFYCFISGYARLACLALLACAARRFATLASRLASLAGLHACLACFYRRRRSVAKKQKLRLRRGKQEAIKACNSGGSKIKQRINASSSITTHEKKKSSQIPYVFDLG